MKRQLIRSRLLKITVAFAMMISAIWLSGCGRQETETEQGAVYVAEDGDDKTGTGAWKAPYATISHAAQTAPGSLIKDTGSAFVPDEEQMKIYKAQKRRNRWNQLLEKVESWFHRFLGESEEE